MQREEAKLSSSAPPNASVGALLPDDVVLSVCIAISNLIDEIEDDPLGAQLACLSLVCQQWCRISRSDKLWQALGHPPNFTSLLSATGRAFLLKRSLSLPKHKHNTNEYFCDGSCVQSAFDPPSPRKQKIDEDPLVNYSH